MPLFKRLLKAGEPRRVKPHSTHAPRRLELLPCPAHSAGRPWKEVYMRLLQQGWLGLGLLRLHSNRELPHVLTSPDPHTPVGSEDCVYALGEVGAGATVRAW